MAHCQCKNIIPLFVLFALIAVAFSHENQGSAHNQGGPHQLQGRVRRQAEPQEQNQGDVIQEEQEGQDEGNQDELEDVPNEWGPIGWTSCDFTQIPRISCHDCTTRKICKFVGGLLKQCSGSRPYCNSGICSPVPSSECAAQA